MTDITELKNIYVTKHTATSDLSFGLIQPVIVERQNGEWEAAKPEQFPYNGLIFITRGYSDLDYRFEDADLIKIAANQISINNKPDEEIKNDRQSKYVALVHLSQRPNFLPVSINLFPHVVEDNSAITAGGIISDGQVNLPFKPRRYVFVWNRQENNLYGPFEASEIESRGTTWDVTLRALAQSPVPGLPDGCVFQKSANDYKIVPTDSHQIMLTDLSSWSFDDSSEYVDALNDNQLVNWGNKILDDSGGRLTRPALQEFKGALQGLTAQNHPFFNQRITRLARLVDETEAWKTASSSLVGQFLNTKDGSKELEQYLRANSSQLVRLTEAHFAAEVEEVRDRLDLELSQLKSEVSDLKQNKIELEGQLKRSKKELEDEKRRELSSELEALEHQIAETQSKLDQKLQRLSLSDELEDLTMEREYLDRRIKELQSEHDTLQNTRDALVEEAKKDTDGLMRRLVAIKPYLDVLDGHSPQSEFDYSQFARVNLVTAPKPPSLLKLTEQVHELLSSRGRDYKPHHIANILITINQSFFTILAGPPGVGKTSLATFLADVMGLQSSKNFLPVSVARGWSSSRDILGFYNPLAHTYQAAATGLYGFLKHIQEDANGAQYPNWVLFDEANLSPMEHYASDFLGMADGHSDRILRLSHNEAFNIPESFRILATVNFDATTEPLSPRVLDRAAVIRLNPEKTLPDYVDFTATAPQEEILLQEDLDALMNPDGGFSPQEERLFQEIQDLLHDHKIDYGAPIIISPRKAQAMMLYCAAARDVIEGSFGYSALDFAIAQQVLPLISGSGEKFKNRLLKLQEFLDHNGLRHSGRLLEHIISAGDSEYGHYQFFS